MEYSLIGGFLLKCLKSSGTDLPCAYVIQPHCCSDIWKKHNTRSCKNFSLCHQLQG